MEKKNNKKGLIALAVVLVLAIAALIIWQVNKPEPQHGGKEITVNVTHLDGDEVSYTISTDEEYLRGALEQEDLIEGTERVRPLYYDCGRRDRRRQQAGMVGLQRQR